MRTIPDRVLDAIVKHTPHFAHLVAQIRNQPDGAQRLERELANAYLDGEVGINPMDVWHLSQVAYGGPWGGDWERATALAARLGVNESRIRQRILAGELVAIKYGKTWYVRKEPRDAAN